MPEIRLKTNHPAARRIAQIAGIAGIALLAGCQPEPDDRDAQARDPGFELTAHRQSATLAPKIQVVLSNPLGDIRIRNQPGNEYLLTAQIQKLNGESRDVEFSETQSDNRLVIDVVAPGDFDGRVDASFLVPDEHPLNLITKNGLIQARVNKNAIDATSESGKLSVRSLANLNLKTSDGPVEVTVHRLGAGDVNIGTRAGPITIEMPPESNLKLVATTGGTFATALAPEVKRATRQSNGRLELTLGAGAANFNVDSETGDISLRSYGYEAR